VKVKITKQQLRKIIQEELANVTEAPIRDFEYETGGAPERFDPKKGKGGFRAQDRKLLMNPKAVEKIKKQWEKTPFNFDIYLLQIAALNKPEYREHGLVKPGSDVALAIRLGLAGMSMEDYERKTAEATPGEKEEFEASLPMVPYPDDGITLLFNGNYGVDKVPLTGWMMAHRLSHAVQRPEWSGRRTRRMPEYENFVRSVNNMFREIVRPYGAGEKLSKYEPWPLEENVWDQYGRGERMKAERTYAYIANQIGTMKSARDNRIDRIGEFYHELIAQYLLTGKITFNDLPRSLVTKRGSWGHEDRTSARDEVWLEQANQFLQASASEIGDRIEDVLEGMVGNAYLM
jgi:hypothetical protein